MGIEYLDNKKCRLVVYAGSDAYGKPRRFKKTVKYTSPRNAEKQYRQFENEVEAGLKKAARISLSEMMDSYIASRKRKGLRSTTLNQYEITKNRILETLGDPYADKVSRKMIDDWIGKLDHDDFASKTIKNTVHFLSACYERSIDMEIVTKNPCRHAEIPDKKKREVVTLSAEDIIPFYKVLQEYREDELDYVVAIELMLFCGLRRSEVAGLKECDIDMINRTVHVANARHTVKGILVEEGTKTARSNRVLALPEFVFNDVMELISLHEENCRRDRNLPNPEYLILNIIGEPIYPNVLYDKLKRMTEKHHLPPVTLHGLRHTYASMLKWLGRDLVEISPQLGHSQQSTTLDIYMHLFQNASVASRSIATDLNEYILKAK